MKIHLLIPFFLLAPFLTRAQVKPIADFYDKYRRLDNVSDLRLQGWLLKLASRHADEEAGKELLNKISFLRVLIMEEGNLVAPGDYRGLLRELKNDAFEEIIRLREGDKHVNLLIREDAGVITDVLIAVSGAEGFLLLSLEGRLRFSDLNDIDLDIEGSEHLRRLPEKKPPRA